MNDCRFGVSPVNDPDSDPGRHSHTHFHLLPCPSCVKIAFLGVLWGVNVSWEPVPMLQELLNVR